jgi:hypothetical protein
MQLEQNRQREQLERQQLEQEKLQEQIRLSNETDKIYGVVSVVSMSDAKSDKLVIGNIYRLNDILFEDNRSFRREGDAFYFGEFEEYMILGNDLLNADVKIFKRTVNFTSITNSGNTVQSFVVPAGKIGYIVRYSGTKQVITNAGFIRILWVFEYIAGNKYVD